MMRHKIRKILFYCIFLIKDIFFLAYIIFFFFCIFAADFLSKQKNKQFLYLKYEKKIRIFTIISTFHDGIR